MHVLSYLFMTIVVCIVVINLMIIFGAPQLVAVGMGGITAMGLGFLMERWS